jgi:hypothetical protein
MSDAEVQARFKSDDARKAYQLLMQEARSVGFEFHYPNSRAKAVEFEEVDGERPFSAIANNAHLLFYLRQPVLRRLPGLFDRATTRFGEVKPNKRGEYRKKVHNALELKELLDWLKETGAWKRRP